MSDNMKVGNPNEVVNDYKGILDANIGALHGAMKDIQAGKAPSAGGAGGSEVNILSEMALAKTGAAGAAMHLFSETSKSHGINDSFFGGGGKRGRTKKDVAFENTVRMAVTNYHPVMGKLSRADNLAAWSKVRKEMSKSYPTLSDLQRNPEKFGLGQIKQNMDAAVHGRDRRTTHEVVAGTEKGFQESRELIKTHNTDQVLDATEKMAPEKREAVIKQVLPAQKIPSVLQPPAPSWAKPPQKGESSDKWN